MKLYRIEVNQTIYAYGSDKEDAIRNGLELFRDGSEVDCFAFETVTGEVPVNDWGGCYPYGADGEWTVGEILSGEKP